MSVLPAPADRATLYALFSRLWAGEPDRPLVEALGSPLGAEVFPALNASAEKAALADDRAATFAADYANLTTVNLVPYESFYRRADAMLESGGVNPVAVFMQRYGFEVDLARARALAPDHLAIELELMHRLCAAQAEAAGRGDAGYARTIETIQRSFLEEHLLTWTPVYLFAVARLARTVLYREAAEATLDFLAQDHAGLVAR